MMESRRQAWFEAEATRREHLAEHLADMHNIRTAVCRRIEQDRKDMDTRMQAMNGEFEKRREHAEKRMIDFRRRAERIEI